MAKASKRSEAAAKRNLAKRAGYEVAAKRGRSKSAYAKKRRGNPPGNDGPNGMWTWAEVG